MGCQMTQADVTGIDVEQVWRVIRSLGEAPDLLKSNWCVPPEAGRFLHVLTRTQQAFRIVEVGTSIGFSTLHLALGVLENLKENPVQASAFVATIDASAERQATAKQHFESCGVWPLVECHTGSALDVLKAKASEWQGSIDLAFIDARKDEYLAYARLLHGMLRPGGILIADNTRSHRKEMQPFIDFMLIEDRENMRQWDSGELDTPNGLIISRKR